MKKDDVKALRPGFAVVPLFALQEQDAIDAGEEFARIANGEHPDMYRLMTEADRTRFMRWISVLPKPKRPILKEIAEELKGLEPAYQGYSVDIEAGRIDLSGAIYIRTDRTITAIAWLMAALLSSKYKNNLRQCKHKPCGRWFFDRAKGRVVKSYCSTAHQNAAAQARHRNSRKTQGPQKTSETRK